MADKSPRQAVVKNIAVVGVELSPRSKILTAALCDNACEAAFLRPSALMLLSL